MLNLKNQMTMLQSMNFANWAHRNQKRKIGKAPYIIHPFHMRWLLVTHGLDPNMDDNVPVFIACDCHDGREDNPEEVTFELIEFLFGPEAARIVKGVTLDKDNPDKRESRKKILASDWKIVVTKVVDVLSNTMATTDAIRRLGLSEVQRHFKQPILERVEMEREFIAAIPAAAEHPCLAALVKSAAKALDELADVAES